MPDSHMTSTVELIECLTMLTPYDLTETKKRRVGRNLDGGYVLADDMAPISTIYSFGVGDEASFELELAASGRQIYMHDHTVSAPPYHHENFHFREEGIGPIDDAAHGLFTLAYQIERNEHDRSSDMLLKIDIEGTEYDVLPTLSQSVLSKFRQIVMELHWLTRLGDPEFRQRFYATINTINEQFALCHVHANNCCQIAIVDGFPVADVLELTFVRRNSVKIRPSRTIFPTELDCANDFRFPDHLLWFYPFIPNASSPGREFQFRQSLSYARRPFQINPLSNSLQQYLKLNDPERYVLVSEPFAGKTKPHNTRRSLNILYFACHEILEYDDLRILTELGHNVFSIGEFANPENKTNLRQAKKEFFRDGDWQRFVSTGGSLEKHTVQKEFARNFDIAIINHNSERIFENLTALGDMPIVYRSIGQSNTSTESILAKIQDRVHIVRYSNKEVNTPGFCRTDDVIYFGKYLNEFPQWEIGSRAITFHNSYPSRATVSVPSLNDYRKLSEKNNFFDLYGFYNEGVEASRGLVSAEMQMSLFRTAGLYFYVYSVPPSYTLSFVEAMAAGVPILAPSTNFIETTLGDVAKQCCFTAERYEIPDLLNHDTRLIFNSLEEAEEKAKLLLNDDALRLAISENLRLQCKNYFDAEDISARWERVLQSLVK